MYRDILTNKWVLGGVGFLIVFTVACYLWYQHDIAPYKQEAADAEKLLRQSKEAKQLKNGKTREKEFTATETLPDIVRTDNTVEQQTHNVTTKVSKETSSQTVTASDIGEKEVKVSPYGFGPYPEVPQGFIDAVFKPLWLLPDEILSQRRKPPSRNVELMQRVMIKLWKQGRTDVQAAFMDGERVRVHFKNHAYVRYSTSTGFNGEEVRYISSWRSGSDIPAPKRDPSNPFDTSDSNIPPGVELIDMDKDPGIDPYEFLGLN